ncbi:uncharacterized protein THITE_2116017 [Thermothielavioides terrestris NRRL 8126]|uniref:Uncharacterized protein n=1 Tax=Thermothielavioides terrestris (strain ATCC 38088 / NRRL 8126) TaxID=578455 RepID=G2QZF1_THETT|nr:uncharacterized protein THITE_2116017 [Thermothielavioides terrestris NRRL 8126]AEO67184.1 hypothetical protein THITE_2116017 [Thermothielavioides terrestris NRRL 8126]
MAAMNVYSEVKRFYTSLQEMVGLRRRKRQLQISEPFDFKKETVILPGLTDGEISVLREKAAASRLGIAAIDADHLPPTTTTAATTTTITTSTTSFPIPSPSPSTTAASSSGYFPPSIAPPRRTSRLSSAPPRLSLPIPIPVPTPNAHHAAAARRHGSAGGAGSFSLRGSSTVGGSAAAGVGVGMGMGMEGGREVEGAGFGAGAGGAGMRTSVSANDLDLLLFGNPSGVGGAGDGCGKEGVVVTAISPVDLHGGAPVINAGDVGGAGSLEVQTRRLDLLEMDFEFQLGSPVSPLEPSLGGVVAERKVLVGV